MEILSGTETGLNSDCISYLATLRITQGIVYTKRARVEIDIINYATKYATEMKAKFSYCDKIKFNESVLRPGTPE